MTTPGDVIQAVSAARQLEPNPLALAARFVGLSGDEHRAGVPGWAWLALAFAAGAGSAAWYLRRGLRSSEPKVAPRHGSHVS